MLVFTSEMEEDPLFQIMNAKLDITARDVSVKEVWSQSGIPERTQGKRGKTDTAGHFGIIMANANR